MNGLISVVIPAYKCENFISSAIESVLCQSYNNYELIVVDDGSPDNVSKVIKEYKNRVKYIFQENGGVSKARNTGIRHSNGEYIAFLDADDKWEYNKLEMQMELFNRVPEVNMVFCSFCSTINNNILINRSHKDAFNFYKEYRYDTEDIFENTINIPIKGEIVKYFYGNIYDYLFLGNFILPSSVIIKKLSLLSFNVFNENYRVSEETEFFLKYSRHNVIGFVDMPLVQYEMPSPGNLSGKSNMESLMKNALITQIDSFISNYYNHAKKDSHYYKGISKTYSRMAYYYLSEYNIAKSREYAIYGLKSYHYNVMPYTLLFGSVVPVSMLRFISKMKNIISES